MSSALRTAVLTFLIAGLFVQNPAGAGIFRHRRRSNCCYQNGAAAVTQPPTSQADVLATAMKEPTIDAAILNVLRSKGLEPGFIPRGVLPDDGGGMPFEVALKWSLVQNNLEDLFNDYLKLEYKPKLHLVIKTVDATSQPPKFRFVFPRPNDERVTEALKRSIPLDNEALDIEIRLIGEYLPVNLDDFRAEYVKDGKPDYVRIQQAILNMLQSQTELTAAARKVNGEIKPIPTPNELTKDRLRLLTQWQPLYQEREYQISWRASIRLQKQSEGVWQLETVIEFGERLRSQSPDQTRVITDTNQLGSFDTSPLDTGGGLHLVKYKPVTSAGRRVLSSEFREHFALMAPMLWNQVKGTILKPKPMP